MMAIEGSLVGLPSIRREVLKKTNVVLIHDWLTGMTGTEK